MELFSDNPVESHEGPHAAIADAVAQIATSPPEDRSLIIGIFGPWGSGKTSVLRMVLQAAEDNGIPHQHLIHFSAWRIDPDEVTQRFFNELANGLGLLADTATIDSLREYARVLSGAGKMAEKVLAASSRIVSILGLLGIGSVALIESRFIQILVLAGAINGMVFFVLMSNW